MARPITASTAHGDDRRSVSEEAWAIVHAAARAADQAAETGQAAAFALGTDGRLRGVQFGDRTSIVEWRPGAGWQMVAALDDPRRPVVDLYLPLCSAVASQPMTIAHVGQSLDGFIAMPSGESHWITGDQNILHMHRLRALCDAVIVGAGTVAADDPQLTTRLVSGPSPLRVVIDPARRLAADHRVFTDAAVDTLYVCAGALTAPDERYFGRALILGVGGDADGIDAAELMRHLHGRGCRRVFVEGGGVTVSTFLAANLLDRLHITIAAVLLGDGRPSIRFPPRVALRDSPRPRYRVFRMGGDILFDCDLTAPGDGGEAREVPPVTRIL